MRGCKKWLRAFAGVLVCLGLIGCGVEKVEGEKIRDVEFTVVDQEEVPEELLNEIEGAKDGEMKLSYGDDGYLYAARGYGEQDTSGYSIEVEECYETEEGIRIKTSLLGPGKEENILNKKTYPFVVIKMEYTDKPVMWD